ncbi:OmpH family outer membrane protein [Candidatus Pelagibacter bacterium nBUS_33]|jgi:outer membrane protein|uniref:OmpH family outer membrane protein n=1 Tax=Candidatus Pelagibacter bacterium nBUS_33 TaxID=3374193 RepID=UPI003EBAD57E
MNYLHKFLLIFFIFFISTNFSNSKETAFIDIDYLVANSNIGKKVLENLNKLDKKNIENLKKKDKSLQELEITIKNKKNVISEDAFNKEVVSFKKKVQEFKVEKNKIVKNFNDFKRKELENVFRKISPIINDYMEENSISILLDSKNIFMGSKKSNLTEDILGRINKEFK